jgi:hypothetical protein
MSNYLRGRGFVASAGTLCLIVVLLCWKAVPQQVTSSTTVSAANLALTATGSHIQTSATGNDLAGTITISSSTSASHTFSTSYSSTPACVATPTSDPTSVSSGLWYVTSTTSGVTVHTHNSLTSLSFNYVCVGNPD